MNSSTSPRKQQDKSPGRVSTRGAGLLSPLANSFRGHPFSRRSSGSRREPMGAGSSRVDSELSATSSLKGMGSDHAFDPTGYETASSKSFSGALGPPEGAQDLAGLHQLREGAFLPSTVYSLATHTHDAVRGRSHHSTTGRAAGSTIDQTLSPGLLQAVVSDAESLSASSSGRFSLKEVEPAQKDEVSALEQQQRFELAAYKKPADRLPRFQSPGSFVASTTPTKKFTTGAQAPRGGSGGWPVGAEQSLPKPSTSVLLGSPKIPALPSNPVSRAASIGTQVKRSGSQVPNDVSGGSMPLNQLLPTLSMKQPGTKKHGPGKRLAFGADWPKGNVREPATREASTFASLAAGAQENATAQPESSPDFVLDIPLDGGDAEASGAGGMSASIGEGAAFHSGPGLPAVEQETSPQSPVTAEGQPQEGLVQVSSRVEELEEASKQMKKERVVLIQHVLSRDREREAVHPPPKAAGRKHKAPYRPSSPLGVTGQEQPVLRHLASLSPNSLLHTAPSALVGAPVAGGISDPSLTPSLSMIPSLAYDRPTIARDSAMSAAPSARMSWISQPLQTAQASASNRGTKDERGTNRASCEGDLSGEVASRRPTIESRGVQALVDREVAKRDEQWTEQVTRIMENARVERELAASEIAALRQQVQVLSGSSELGTVPLGLAWTSQGAPAELESLRRRCADLDGLVDSLNADLAQKESELLSLKGVHDRTVTAMRTAEEALGAAEGKIGELEAELERARAAAALTTGTRTPEFLSPGKQTTISSVPPSPSTLSHTMSDLGSVNEVSSLKLANEALLCQLEEQRMAAVAAESAVMLAKDDVRRLEIQVQQQGASLRHGEQQVQELETSLQEARNERELWRERYLQAGQEGRQREEELRKQRQGLLEEMEGVRGEKEALRRELEDAKGEAGRAKRKQEDLEEALDAKQQECLGLKAQMQRQERALAAKSEELLQAQCAHQQHASAVVSLQSHVEGLKKLVEHKTAVEVRLHEEKEALRLSLQQASDDARVAQNNFSRLQETRRKEEVDAAELRFAVSTQKDKMERLKAEITQLQAQKAESQSAYCDLKEECEELRAKLAEAAERNLALEGGSPFSRDDMDGVQDRLWGM